MGRSSAEGVHQPWRESVVHQTIGFEGTCDDGIPLATVAFLGIGLMGSRQARRLLERAIALTVWNRSRERPRRSRPSGPASPTRPPRPCRRRRRRPHAGERHHRHGRAVRAGAARGLRPGSHRRRHELHQARGGAGSRAAAGGARHPSHRCPGLRRHARGGAGDACHHGGRRGRIFARVEPILHVMGRPVHVGPHGAGQLRSSPTRSSSA